MSLTIYQRKRNFGLTAEPKGRTGATQRNKPLSFVIQKHAASHLHYDFRLELDGVLKSWAVPKGPSARAGEKRLAVQVEDHPLDYADFEGTIAEHQYGAGAVIVWDRGRWAPTGNARKALAEGKLTFRLDGEKLRGGYTLVRMAKAAAKPQWLLLKSHDDEAIGASASEPIDALPTSVLTGRRVEDISSAQPEPLARARRAARNRNASHTTQNVPANEAPPKRRSSKPGRPLRTRAS